jgi:hypothetical protein
VDCSNRWSGREKRRDKEHGTPALVTRGGARLIAAVVLFFTEGEPGETMETARFGITPMGVEAVIRF